MNLIDATVVEVLSEPRLVYEKWFVKARVNSWGHKSFVDVMFDTKEDAAAIKEGDVVQV